MLHRFEVIKAERMEKMGWGQQYKLLPLNSTLFSFSSPLHYCISLFCPHCWLTISGGASRLWLWGYSSITCYGSTLKIATSCACNWQPFHNTGTLFYCHKPPCTLKKKNLKSYWLFKNLLNLYIAYFSFLSTKRQNLLFRTESLNSVDDQVS